MMRFRRRLSLFWRIYFYGLFLLFIVAVTAGLATYLANVSGEGPRLHSSHKMIARLFTAYVIQHPGGGDELDALLERLHEMTRISISIFDTDNRRIAHAGDLVPSPIPPEKLKQVHRPRFMLRESMSNSIIPLDGDTGRLGYAILSWKGTDLHRFLGVLTAVLAMLALMPYLLARTIARPLKRISDTTRRIGEGHLSDRTGIDRNDEIGVLAREVDGMATRIESLIRSEKALMANISHEIRTPLARIRVLLELLEESGGRIEPDQLESLHADTVELDRLLEDVFMTARLDLMMDSARESTLVLKRESLSIPELARDTAKRFRKRFPDHPLIEDVSSDLPLLSGDRILLRRMLMNLLENAVKVSPPGTPVELSVRRTGNRVEFRIADRGTGIAPADLERVFEPFFRGERTPGTGQPGIGIGLTLCRRIARAHGGSIHAENRDGGGAVFIVSGLQ